MIEVIDLRAHMEHEGTMWFTGLAGCTACGETQVSVVAFPAWACGPAAMECEACGKVSCLPVADADAVCPWVGPPGMPGPAGKVDDP